ncbi:uncharacterized protein GLRG_12001 [Colletotrichum graminicola M1.001]|uniref:Uncharacterized protein n=1 Tax=Colletotrichum graminicola (strain M1.001 / M2 / FGSC 10212) TaxID=645133 RepID=E3R167_COLGM|nr:uncharacterized protein GLRG_12001 [Colletotrichum graminicola M1.001]EFQ36855.1 hypothetical protein GLRG_12001 [Colletotrichum graminicola M1.001]
MGTIVCREDGIAARELVTIGMRSVASRIGKSDISILSPMHYILWGDLASK